MIPMCGTGVSASSRPAPLSSRWDDAEQEESDSAMATEAGLEWTELSWDRMTQHSRRGRYLWVSVGTHGHVTVLPSSVSILDALANFADGHAPASGKQAITLTYQMWQDGQIMGSGKHSFDPKR